MQSKAVTGKGSENPCTLSELFYLIYFSILLFSKGIGLIDGQLVYYALTGIGLFFLLLKILSTDHSVFEYLWMILLMLLGLVVYRVTGQKGLLLCFTVLVGMKGVSTRRVFKAGIVIWSVCFAAMWILTMTGVIHEQVWMHDKHGIGLALCHSMGYSHSNVMHVGFLILAMMICCLYDRKDKADGHRAENRVEEKKTRRNWILLTLFLLILNVVVFFYSMSYTGFLACGIYLILNLILVLRGRLSGFEKILLQLIFPACVLFICVGPLVIRGRLFDLINKALTTRYYLSYYYLTEQSATLFGQRYNLDYHLTMDSSYIYLLRQYGVIAFVLVLVLYFGLIHDEVRNDRRSELALTLGTCVAGTTEQFLFNTAYKNLSLIFAGAYLFRCSERAEQHLPAIFRKHRAFLPGRDRDVSFVLTDRLAHGFRELFSGEKVKIRAGIAFVVLILGIFGAVLVLPRTSALYIDEDVNELSDRQAYYFTEEEMESRKAEGDLFYYYTSPSDPMYLYDGSTANLEYARRLLFVGLVCGGAAYVIGSAVTAGTDRRKRGVKG